MRVACARKRGNDGKVRRRGQLDIRWRKEKVPTIRAQLASPVSQPWGFIPLEIGIVSAKEQGLQAVSVLDNRAGNPLPLDFDDLSQPVDRGDNLPVNQGVV